MRPLMPTSRTQLLALGEYTRRRVAGLAGADGLGLAPYELKVSSQNGEDGVLGEILRRAGITAPGFFVEFGAEDGVELNCALLADAFGWSGAFLEGDPEKHGRLHRKYAPSGRVVTRQEMVRPETIEGVFGELGVPTTFDVLSIDVDGDDYWVWKAIERYSPAVVIIEINSHIDPRSVLVQPPGGEPWQGTDWYGASVAAVRQLGADKGYRLVHVEMTGNNAFFVRSDVSGAFPDEVMLLGPNHYLLGGAHPVDASGRSYMTPGER